MNSVNAVQLVAPHYDFHHSSAGWLFRLHAPGVDFHLGFSRSSKTLCGRNSDLWPCDSASREAVYCAACLDKVRRQMPHLQIIAGKEEADHA